MAVFSAWIKVSVRLVLFFIAMFCGFTTPAAAQGENIAGRKEGQIFYWNPAVNSHSRLQSYSRIRAALRSVINSGFEPDSTLCGMYNLPNVYENVAAYFDPEMSDEERDLLNNVKRLAKRTAKS